MEVFSLGIIFRGVIAQQTNIKKIGCARLKLEGRQIAFVEGRSVRPDPAGVMFLQQPDDFGFMPPGVAKLDGKTKIVWQLPEKRAQR